MSEPIVLYVKLLNVRPSMNFGEYPEETAEFRLRLEIDPESRTVLDQNIEMISSSSGYDDDLKLSISEVSVDSVAV